MGMVITLDPYKGIVKRWRHKLFSCPTFWRLKPYYYCSKCSKGMRCYWDGNDISGHGTDICNSCAKKISANEGQ